MPLNAAQTLNRDFLEMRAKVLELAASFDRLDRLDPEGTVWQDPRLGKLLNAIAALAPPAAEPGPRDERAAQVQLIFSRPYEPDWRRKFGV